ncbi:MAG: hypothetical protein MZV65_27290 [Chromatiales bacterium]|nr:hypothetical protein [Chromatiales bacterium]
MGFLLYQGKQGVQRRVESLAAEQVADRLRDRLAFDAEAFVWFLWSETHWQPLQSSARAERLIADVIHVGTDPVGFRPAYLSGVVTIVQKRCLLPRPPAPKDVVPFQNGLLDLHTRALRPASPDHALDWVLPHSYDAKADCPTIRGWLMKAVEDDEATVELLARLDCRPGPWSLVAGLPDADRSGRIWEGHVSASGVRPDWDQQHRDLDTPEP